MQVEVANAPAYAQHGDETHYFCSDNCRRRFAADPAREAALEQSLRG
jgi:YHS domain-containing protein